MSEQLADDRQTHGRARADGGERMPQVVKPNAFKSSGFAERSPRLLQVRSRRAWLLPGNDMRIAFDPSGSAAITV